MAKQARVLSVIIIDGITYSPNQVVVLADDLAKQFEKEGSIDSGKAAIAYCINDLGATPIVHQDPAEQAAAAAASQQKAGALAAAQAAVDAAQAAVNAESDQAKKADLGIDLQKAQAALDALNAA